MKTDSKPKRRNGNVYAVLAYRKAELRRTIDKLPGDTNADRLRKAAELLSLKPNTIRGWLLKDPHRHVPERQLALLRTLAATA